MAVTEFTDLKEWQELAPWYQMTPFKDARQRPIKMTRETAHFMPWGPDKDGLHRTPVTFYVSTKALTVGVFSLAPGDYFKPGNHPNPEPYLILSGTLLVGDPDTGKYSQLEAGDAYVIPAFSFHVGYNFGSKTVEIAWMIPRETHTKEMRANPNYDDHYQNVRNPIVLHRETVHTHQSHNSWAQSGHLVGQSPKSRLNDLLCWPPLSGTSPHSQPECDQIQLCSHRDWLHFVTGKDYDHQFLTSFFYSTKEFQAGKITVPPNRVTNAISVKGERVYFAKGDNPFIVTMPESGESLWGTKGDALFVPANVVHQFQNSGHDSMEAIMFSATNEGVTYY
jgi:mannose-6-phosphate isomerase-like protein (cupin superfamily)